MKTKQLGIGIAFSSFLALTTQTMNIPFIVACNFDATSSNEDTSRLISNAFCSAKHILKSFSWKSLWNLQATVAHMKKRGDEIAISTPGITNTIETLLAELQQQGYGTFNEDTVSCFNEMGVNPVPDPEAINLVAMLKTFNIPVLATGNKDSKEYEIYARKMFTNHGIDIQELFDGVVTIPTLEERALFSSSPGDCFARSARWLVSRGSYKENSYTNTVRMLASDLFTKGSILPIDTKEQLTELVNALHQVKKMRPPSPDATETLDSIIRERRYGLCN